MKRITIMTLLIMAFVSFATVDSFADNSPPGVDVGISYELPVNIDLIETNFTGVAGTIEARIAVYHCDLKCWPNSVETFNIYTNSIQL